MSLFVCLLLILSTNVNAQCSGHFDKTGGIRNNWDDCVFRCNDNTNSIISLQNVNFDQIRNSCPNVAAAVALGFCSDLSDLVWTTTSSKYQKSYGCICPYCQCTDSNHTNELEIITTQSNYLYGISKTCMQYTCDVHPYDSNVIDLVYNFTAIGPTIYDNQTSKWREYSCPPIYCQYSHYNNYIAGSYWLDYNYEVEGRYAVCYCNGNGTATCIKIDTYSPTSEPTKTPTAIPTTLAISEGKEQIYLYVAIIGSIILLLLVLLCMFIYFRSRNKTLKNNMVYAHTSDTSANNHGNYQLRNNTQKVWTLLQFLMYIGLYIFDIIDYITTFAVVNQFLNGIECTIGEKKFDLYNYGIILVILTCVGLLFATVDTVLFVIERWYGCNCFVGKDTDKQHLYHLIFEIILNVFQDALTSFVTLIPGYMVGFVSTEFKASIIVNGIVSIVYGLKNILELRYSTDVKSAIYSTCTSCGKCVVWFFYIQIIVAVITLIMLGGLTTNLDSADNRIMIIDGIEHDFSDYINTYHDIEGYDDLKLTIICEDFDSSTRNGWNLPNDGTIIHCGGEYIDWTGYQFGDCDEVFIPIDSCGYLDCNVKDIKPFEICYGYCKLN